MKSPCRMVAMALPLAGLLLAPLVRAEGSMLLNHTAKVKAAPTAQAWEKAAPYFSAAIECKEALQHTPEVKQVLAASPKPDWPDDPIMVKGQITVFGYPADHIAINEGSLEAGEGHAYSVQIKHVPISKIAASAHAQYKKASRLYEVITQPHMKLEISAEKNYVELLCSYNYDGVLSGQRDAQR